MLSRALSKSLFNTEHLSRKSVSGFDHPPGKGMLYNIHSKPSLIQLWPAPMHSAIGYQREEISTSFITSPSQEDAEGNEVIPQHHLFQWSLEQSPWLLLDLSPSSWVCWPPLDRSQDFHILLKLWDPELHTVLQMRGCTNAAAMG